MNKTTARKKTGLQTEKTLHVMREEMADEFRGIQLTTTKTNKTKSSDVSRPGKHKLELLKKRSVRQNASSS